jgi:hypothetical protein
MPSTKHWPAQPAAASQLCHAFNHCLQGTVAATLFGASTNRLLAASHTLVQQAFHLLLFLQTPAVPQRSISTKREGHQYQSVG